MMIEGPLENVVASLEAIVRRERENEEREYREDKLATERFLAWYHGRDRERRLRIIRNLPRNRHAWKGKRFPVDESKLPAPPQRSGLEPLPLGYYPKGD
jgi:hypothetical protein